MSPEDLCVCGYAGGASYFNYPLNIYVAAEENHEERQSRQPQFVMSSFPPLIPTAATGMLIASRLRIRPSGDLSQALRAAVRFESKLL